MDKRNKDINRPEKCNRRRKNKFQSSSFRHKTWARHRSTHIRYNCCVIMSSKNKNKNTLGCSCTNASRGYCCAVSEQKFHFTLLLKDWVKSRKPHERPNPSRFGKYPRGTETTWSFMTLQKFDNVHKVNLIALQFRVSSKSKHKQ